MTLLSPIFRDSLSPKQCISDQSSQSHLLTSLSSIEPLSWEVTSPDPFSNCSLILFPESDSSKYIELYMHPSSQHKFACAHSTGIETFSFKIPSKFVCSLCTIQLKVESKSSVKYACADIQVYAGKKTECTCKNDGVCVNDVCKCVNGFTGDHCERGLGQENPQSSVFKFLLASLIVFVLITTVYLYMHPEKLPENLKNFLEKHARWMLRNPERY